MIKKDEDAIRLRYDQRQRALHQASGLEFGSQMTIEQASAKLRKMAYDP